MRKIKKIVVLFMAIICFIVLIPASFLGQQATQVEAASKLKISKTRAVLVQGQNLQLKLNTKVKAKWSSSNKKVLTVNQKGRVTAKNKGTAKVTARIGKRKVICTIKVEIPKISNKSIKMVKGERTTLKITGTAQKIIWKSSRKNIATVNSKGMVMAKAKGSTVITAVVNKKLYTCKVSVQSPYLKKTNLTLKPLQSIVLKLYGTTRKPKWASSDTSIVTVNSTGNITAKKEGVAVIYAMIGKIKYNCRVTVKTPTPEKGSRENPYNAYEQYSTDIYDYGSFVGNFTVQLLDYKQGHEAYNLVMQNENNTAPTAGQEYIYMKFIIKYNSGSESVDASTVINYHGNIFNHGMTNAVTNIDWGFNYDLDVEDMTDTTLYPGGSAVCSVAILVRSGNTPVTYRLETGQTSDYEPIYKWFRIK